jgi:hypothetical protein
MSSISNTTPHTIRKIFSNIFVDCVFNTIVVVKQTTEKTNVPMVANQTDEILPKILPKPLRRYGNSEPSNEWVELENMSSVHW